MNLNKVFIDIVFFFKSGKVTLSPLWNIHVHRFTLYTMNSFEKLGLLKDTKKLLSIILILLKKIKTFLKSLSGKSTMLQSIIPIPGPYLGSIRQPGN